MARPAPERDVAPVVQRVRMHYAKRGRLRFSSHRDFQRALERALRRAEVPMAYSAGFSPHPKISYANSAPTGVASEAEYVELGLARAVDTERLTRALDEALPEGLDVVEIVEARTPDLVARLEASHWRIELPGLAPGAADAAVDALLAQEEVEVERLTKNGVRRFDARGPIVRLQGVAGDCAILETVVRHVTPSVRPDDVLAALRRVADLVPPEPPRVIRLAQGPLDPVAAVVGDPFAPDRGASRQA
jgi:radical SAM-linked protein